MDAVGELVVDREVVVALAALGLADHLAAAHADGPDRMGAQRPAGDVEVVHVLLDDVVAAEPEEVVPVADLVLGVAPARLAACAPRCRPGSSRRGPVIRSPIAPSWIRFMLSR